MPRNFVACAGDAIPVDDLDRLEWLIEQLELTGPDSWQTDVVPSLDAGGERICFFGHLFNIGGGDTPASDSRGSAGSQLWDWFEHRWATTYRIYPINDGSNPEYLQPTASARILAFLRDLRAGRQLCTAESMERSYQLYLADEAAKMTAEAVAHV